MAVGTLPLEDAQGTAIRLAFVAIIALATNSVTTISTKQGTGSTQFRITALALGWPWSVAPEEGSATGGVVVVPLVTDRVKMHAALAVAFVPAELGSNAWKQIWALLGTRPQLGQ